MTPKPRRIVLGVVVVLLAALVIAWWFSGFSLDFMRFFAAEPVTDSTITPTPSQTAPPTSNVSGAVACLPATQTVAVGQGAQLSATGGVPPYEWFAPGATKDSGTGAAFTATYNSKGTKKVTIQAARTDGVNTDSVVCTVIVTP